MLPDMKIFSALWLTLLATITCATETTYADVPEHFRLLLEDYVEQDLYDNPVTATYLGDNRYNNRFRDPISEAGIDERKQREKVFLRRLYAIDPAALDTSDRLSWESFELDRRIKLDGFRFPRHYLPLNQFNGWQIEFPAYASGDSVQPFASVEDYANFVQRAEEFTLWLDSTIPAMREGMRKGYVQPSDIVEKMLPQLRSQIVDRAEDSSFFLAVEKMPASFSEQQQAEIRSDYRRLIKDTLVPAYRRLLDFMEQEYLPQTRDTVGLYDLPGGHAWYAWEVARRTTLPLTAAEIHRTGLAEVARIRAEMTSVKQQVQFAGDLQAFFQHLKQDDRYYFESEQALLSTYRKTLADIKQRLPQLFDMFPTADLEVRAIEPWRARSSAGASFQDAPADGSRPAIFYINTYNLRAQPRFGAETLSLHEALPGHFFQGALQLENTALPRYRRYNGYTVYSEGWALYAESLGRELGLFKDPYSWYGRLNDEQLRAMRLVVDTGLHAMGWSRERAITYMLENSSLAASDIEAEVERYIVWPGQALAYKIGDLRLQALRAKAERALGDNFNIRDFHRQILLEGALPMPVLERKLVVWISSQRAEYSRAEHDKADPLVLLDEAPAP
jgi:uncharacterized protein (DUF885 family)